MSEPNSKPKPRERKRRRTRSVDSVFFDETKVRWVARVTIGQHENGFPRHARRFFKTKAEAERALSELHVQAQTGRLVISPNLTLGAYLDQWITSHRRVGAARTEEFYRGLIERHIRPSLGGRPLAKLQPGEIQALYGKLESQGMARTAFGVHQTLRAALKKAVSLGLLGTSPVERVESPTQNTREVHCLTLKQLGIFLQALAEAPLELRALASVGIGSGLRLGELTGVRWSDIDLNTGELHVRGQLSLRGEKSLVPLKTKRSMRVVVLPEFALKALSEERVRQTARRFSNPLDLAFLNSMGSPWHQKNANRFFKLICRKAGLPELSSHALFRHGFATAMLGQGVPMQDVSKILGHSSVTLTIQTYHHHEVDAARRAAEKLGAVLNGTRGTSKQAGTDADSQERT